MVIVRSLPRGVGVVKVKTPAGILTLVSDRLTSDEARVGRSIAAWLVRRCGLGAAILTVSEIATISDAMAS